MDFCHLQEIYPTNMGKKLLDVTKITGLGPTKTSSRNVGNKNVQVTGELIGNKIAENIRKPRPLPVVN